jgi:hypothetical protein
VRLVHEEEEEKRIRGDEKNSRNRRVIEEGEEKSEEV